PAHREVRRAQGLDLVDHVEHDHALVGGHRIRLEPAAVLRAAPHLERDVSLAPGRRHQVLFHAGCFSSDITSWRSSSGIWGSGSAPSSSWAPRLRTTTFFFPHSGS